MQVTRWSRSAERVRGMCFCWQDRELVGGNGAGGAVCAGW